MPNKLTSFCLLAVVLGCTAPRAVAQKLNKNPTPAEITFFETKVRPLLAENCFRCHGPEKQKGELAARFAGSHSARRR